MLSISLTFSCSFSLLKVTGLDRDSYALLQFLDKLCLLVFLFLLRIIKISASLLWRVFMGDGQIGHYEKTKNYEKDMLHPFSIS